MSTLLSQLPTIREAIAEKSEAEALAILADLFPEKIVFSSSLGYEDQVITDLIYRNQLPVSVFTLDTGRLFEESQKTLQRTNQRYDTRIRVYYPDLEQVEKMVTEKGPYSFYDSIENRKECCYIRKVIPLNRALQGAAVWVTGIRAEQSGNRQAMEQIEWDEAHGLFKFHPLLHWSFEDVKSYVKSNHVPYNLLHDRGFVSIGCAPCTRAIVEGEDFRAGRWWWEDESKKECGLHAR